MKITNSWRSVSIGFTAVMIMALAVACGGGGGGGGSDPYLQPWYNVYGEYCGAGEPRPGCNFYSDGYKIIDVEDPYFSSSYVLEYGYWDYYDSYGNFQTYLGWGWGSYTQIIYDEYGRALNEIEEDSGRDIVSEAAEQADAVIEGAGKAFAESYALNEEKGIEIARTLNDWATLTKYRTIRARTEKDIADFSKRLYGVDMKDALAALESAKSGSVGALVEINTDIAKHWGTSPETSETIMRKFYEKQLSEYGVK